MSLIDDKELLKQYGMDNPADIFTAIDKNESSYWQEKDPCKGMTEYGFNTPVEMMELLDGYIDDKKLQKLIVAASFKRRKAYLLKHENDVEAGKQELPEFVYAF